MLVAHITDLEELRILSKIKEAFPVNPEIYIEIADFHKFPKTQKLFFGNISSGWEDRTIFLLDEDNKAVAKAVYTFNPNSKSIYGDPNTEDIVKMEFLDIVNNESYELKKVVTSHFEKT